MTRTAYTQSSLFRRAARAAQPSVSYTPGPNPALGRFVEQHATPYDPAGDAYNVPPFDKPITSTKATAIYNMHTYWSKKPHDAIRQYIRHYTRPGDLVLDPFCGSGGTALAALMEGRKAVAVDLSPAATFITKNYCTPVDPDALQRAFESLEAAVRQEMAWLYATRCDRCDGRAATAYTVYSYIFQCPRCLEKVPLFDCVEVESRTAKGKPKTINVCPHCHARGHTEEISTRSERFDAVPVLASYECLEGCKPKRGERRHNDPNPKKRDYFERYDLGKLAEIDARPIPHWVPPHRMMNVESDTEPWGDEWRPGRNFRTVAELYTKRNLWAVSALIANTEDTTLRFCISSLLLKASKLMAHNKDGIGRIKKGTYYLPQIEHDIHVGAFLTDTFQDMLRAAERDLNILKDPVCLISTQSATDLSQIETNSIDFVFTDPPYAGNVQYGELNFVWEAWLGFDTNWHEQEITVNNNRGVSNADWARLMRDAFAECYRVLKPGRWLSLCYHDSSEGTWHLVQDIMAEIGFISEMTDTVLSIEMKRKTENQMFGDKVTKRDLVINFRKPRPDELPEQIVITGDEESAVFTEKAHIILRETLQNHPGSTADRLYDELVSRMVRRGAFERHNFDQLLRGVAEEAGGRWYLLETAGQVDAAEAAKEEAAAARLERFMRAALADRPAETGVHFSDLFEQALFVADKPRRELKEWLPEHFYRTDDGAWRPPAGDEERRQKAALRAGGTLRRIKRFGNALLEGAPPAARDRPENLSTAADWLRQCRRAGLYELGRALYEKGGFNFAALGEEAYLEVEEDYQVCVRRS